MARPKRNVGKAKAQGGTEEKGNKGKAPARAPARAPTTRSAGVRKQTARLARGRVAALDSAPHVLDTFSDHMQSPDDMSGSIKPGVHAGSGAKSGDTMDWTPDHNDDNDNGPGEQSTGEGENASTGVSEDSNLIAYPENVDEPEEQIPLPSQARRNSYPTVRWELESLKRQIREFVNEYYTFRDSDSDRYRTVKTMLQKMSPDLRRYIGCIAQGGPKGAEGWMNLLCNNGLQRVLLAGIIGRVLVEHVFLSLYFGADEDQEEVIRTTELDSLMNTKDDGIC